MVRLLLISIGSLICTEIYGQAVISGQDLVRDYLRLLEIRGKPLPSPIFYYANQTSLWEADSTSEADFGAWSDYLTNFREEKGGGLKITPLSPSFTYNYSSRYPRSYNDGPVWNGRGSTISLNAGIEVEWGILKAVFYPNYYIAQNKEFPLYFFKLPNKSIYSYQFAQNIDYVQRFGNSAHGDFDLGQSSLGIEFRNFSVKISNENLWWGPSLSNPILMSNAGPGFLHIDLGTAKPWVTKFGDFELHHVWGRLKESQYFDTDPNNNKRYFVGASFGYRPSFIKELKGLSFGFARVLYRSWPTNHLKLQDVFLSVNNPGRNDEADEMTSIFTRWYFEEAGVEIYSEWTGSDSDTDVWDFFQEITNSMAFTLGFQKTFSANNGFWRFGLEHTTLARTRTNVRKAFPIFYVNDLVRQGYTHDGQLIGASIGPGSKNQLLRLDRFIENGKFSFSFQRFRSDDDAFYNIVGPLRYLESRDVEFTFGLGYTMFTRNMEIGANMYYSRRSNRYYFYGDDLDNYQFLTYVRMHIFRDKSLNF
ncbi:MAG: hypothetical protein O2887_05515 [Bacteroidetes bacterium]|nr:hypothetical protein [Bacteroidota bacterium]MDA1119939.1 hypothetical protein [Bacteroidota bacterium]